VRILLLGAAEGADELASDLAAARGLLLISLGTDTALADDAIRPYLSDAGAEAGFVLHAPDVSAEQAAQLEQSLRSLAAPLDLALQLEVSETAPRPGSEATATDSGAAYFRQKRLLRRVRGEASRKDIAGAALRILGDLEQARSPEIEEELGDVSSAAPARPSEPLNPAAPDLPEGSDSRSRPATSSVPSWKKAAAERGRRRRGRDYKRRGN
jgi:hypothetical protein